MKYSVTLPQFENAQLELEISIWTGKMKLWKDDVLFERSSEKGRPFRVPNSVGEIVEIYPKFTAPDMVPALEIDGVKHNIVEKLPWYQYALAFIPLLMIFGGGALGGAIGGMATVLNLHSFRSEESDLMKYLKVLGVTAMAYFIVLALSFVFLQLGS